MMSATISNLAPQLAAGNQHTPVALRRAGQDPSGMMVSAPVAVPMSSATAPTADSFTPSATTPEGTAITTPTTPESTEKKGLDPIALAVGVGTSLAAAGVLAATVRTKEEEGWQRFGSLFLATGLGVASTLLAPIGSTYIQDLLKKKPETAATTPDAAMMPTTTDATTTATAVAQQPMGVNTTSVQTTVAPTL